MRKDAPDLNHTAPRSPAEILGDLAHLARMLDKARALHAGTLGEYIYPCPMDLALADFLQIDPHLFQKAAATRTDAQMIEWITMHGVERSRAEKAAFTAELLSMAPDEENLPRFIAARDAAQPGRDDVTTWAQLIDLDEGRLGGGPPSA
ncbi:MAG: DUF5069 domain-containing protein [Nitrospirota bacterium]|nr:DUF5069 domain-containing protein [Nitrospirota bacterium]